MLISSSVGHLGCFHVIWIILVSVALVSQFSFWPKFELSCFALLLHVVLSSDTGFLLPGVSHAADSLSFAPEHFAGGGHSIYSVVLKLISPPSSRALRGAAPGRDWTSLDFTCWPLVRAWACGGHSVDISG